jgi:RNA polymerase subunit RPABC4/transcription elongation factor Spt4
MASQNDFMGRIKDNWQQRAKERTTFKSELRIIPRGIVWLMCALYLVALAVVFWISITMPNFPVFGMAVESLPLKLLAVFGIVTALAIVASAFLMFYGYIGADAKRRGMSPVLWVLVSLLVPYLIGIILYFIVREPLPLICPQCGGMVNSQFNFCPNCKFNLRPACPECRRAINPGDRFCPHCGFTMDAASAAPPNAQTA